MNRITTSITRTQTNASSVCAPEYEYTIAFRALKPTKSWTASIQFGFSTERPGLLKSSRFSGHISAEQFPELARLMFEADPQAAIRAFGTVMQAANIQGSPDTQTMAA